MATAGDIVLIYYGDKPTFFARIEEIFQDHKPHWFHVKLLVLQIPIVEVVWILREEYINGASFTMGGHSLRIKLVTGPDESARHDPVNGEGLKHDRNKSGKVIPLFGEK